MNSANITPSQLSEALAAQVHSVVRELLPNGKRIGQEWCVGSTNGEPGNSCKIRLTGASAGVWCDFAAGDKGGDLLDLWCAVRGCDLRTAMQQAKKFLGIKEPQFHGHRPPVHKKPKKSPTMRSLAKAQPVMDWLVARGLTEETIKSYKIIADHEDVVVFPYLRDDEVIHFKFRSIREKKFWSSAETEKCLFGWQVIDQNARQVVITEGEMDAMAMFQYGWPALSVPYGAGKEGKQDWIQSEYERLQQFDRIYLCMDADREGEIAVADIVDRLGRERCFVVTLPHKDANECLMKGVPASDIAYAISESHTMDPGELRNAILYKDAVLKHFYPESNEIRGFTLPWEKAADRFVFEWGATTIIAGNSGHGKSEVVGQITVDAIAQKVSACVASLEFKPEKWIARIVRQLCAEQFPSRERIEHAMQWLEPGLWAFEVERRGAGTAKIDRLLEVFAYARSRYGTRLFVVDNFSKLGIGEDDLNEQKRAITMVTEFAVEHNVHVIVVAHMRKGENDYIQAGKSNVRGSSAITDLADNVWIMWRNRKKEARLKEIAAALHGEGGEAAAALRDEKADLENKVDAALICEKYRNGDDEPRLGLFFDRVSHQFVEQRMAPPRRYL